MTVLAVYLAVGAVAGLLAGLLGVGGGIVIVPALVFVFHSGDFSAELIMHLAVGTSLGTIIVTSISSVWAHHRRGAVDWSVFWRLAPGIVAGALAGAWIADALASVTLQRVFGCFALCVAVQMALARPPAPHRDLPGSAVLLGAGTVIGAVSALVGIGGGSLTVPFLTWCNVAMTRAVATSAAGGLPIAAAGTLGFVITGWGRPGLPEAATGYVYWPALLGIIASSTLFAPLGARLAHSLPTRMLKRVFAVFLAVVGLRLLLA